jgi:CelD/BcsL family acetyltransferase involved in cellulose biosynthesis
MALTSPLHDHGPADAVAGRRLPGYSGCLAVDLGEDSPMNLFAAPWARLGSTAILPAPMNIEEVLSPLFRHLAPSGRRVQIAAVIAEHGELAALAAFERLGIAQGRPLAVSASWMADLPLSGTPLIGPHDPDDALARLVAGATRLQGTHAVLFRLVPNDPAFAQRLSQAARRLGVPPPVTLEPFERAALVRNLDYDDWFEANFARKRRKEFRRLAARLAETGKVETLVKQPGEPLSRWIEDFLALESAGWKGRRGTALACSNDSARFLAESLDRLDERGELVFWRLTFDGRPIAMLFAIVTGGTAFLGKIAHDQAFARYSPGVLLILEATRTLLGRPDNVRADSCAAPGHPMIDNIWRDRVPLADMLISAPGTPPPLFAAIAAAERIRRPLRATAKSLYHQLRKGCRHALDRA